MIANKLKTGGSALFVAADIKPHLNIDSAFTADDSLIDLYIASATDYFEKRTGRALMQASHELYLSDWFYGSDYLLQLPIGPLVSVTSVKYYDVNNDLQTLDTANYRVHAYDVPGLIELHGNLPDLYDRPDAVIIEYVAGYGASGDNAASQRTAVPAMYKQTIRAMVTDHYNWRGNDQNTPIYQVSKKIDDLLVEHKLHTKVFFEFDA